MEAEEYKRKMQLVKEAPDEEASSFRMHSVEQYRDERKMADDEKLY